jgi:hypothetical protein
MGKHGIAYESIVSTLDVFPFQLTGPSAVQLLGTRLMVGFKTERPQDARFESGHNRAVTRPLLSASAKTPNSRNRPGDGCKLDPPLRTEESRP